MKILTSWNITWTCSNFILQGINLYKIYNKKISLYMTCVDFLF